MPEISAKRMVKWLVDEKYLVKDLFGDYWWKTADVYIDVNNEKDKEIEFEEIDEKEDSI